MADYPFSELETKFLEALLRNKVEFMIVGLSAAAIQGAPVVTQDVDLWFENLTDIHLKKALVECGVAYIPPDGNHPPMFAGGGASLFDIVVHMHGLATFQEEKQNTISLPFNNFQLLILQLERIIVSKRNLGRAKDRLVLPVLDDALATLRKKEKE